jgi:hypothetical protein
MSEMQGVEKTLWPNQQEPVDGVEPTEETPQGADFLEDDAEGYDYDQEMGDS